MIPVTQQDNRVVLRPSGEEIVAATVPELRATMRTFIEGGVREIVLDLSGVRTVDSSGLALLVSACNSLRNVGGRLAVIHASQDLLNLFQFMRMHRHFNLSGN
jgi:anti-anti-sigma factor